MKSDDKLSLGDTARDRISGFEGIVIAKTFWLNGCIRIAIQPQKLGDKGLPIEMQTFDIEQCDLVQAGSLQPGTRSGGPMPNPVR